ncbi:TIGR01459 family HAD-type hydrolase [Bradyrhizobium genosp. L]|uniref:TIGR01459 family HAD-type hydrolase n=1 Tax=Bradyrhizobium genosp. L TaxID=83637 RepID=UPI0018A24F82|nr:TIGR01459 family HAD-type hydrolase [Bradyrhizobium genosp. L]QPF86805.1 TIGR01459 family HAD-type hydrolase [Bradyrhizobium genosp. L]
MFGRAPVGIPTAKPALTPLADVKRITGMREIVERFDLFLVDQYGVLHDGVAACLGTIDGLNRIAAYGRKVVVLTNSGKSSAANLDRLRALGFAGSCIDAVVSSGEVALQCVKSGVLGPPFMTGAAACVIGRADERYAFSSDDFELVAHPQDAAFLVFAGSDAPRIPLQAYHRELASAARAGVPAICVNPDITMMRDGELVPAPGAIARLYEDLGGAVEYVGKPHLLIFAQAIATAALDPDARAIMIGDSPEHDVAGARQMGLSTLLVRTGIHRDLPEPQLLQLCEQADAIPDFLMPAFRW